MWVVFRIIIFMTMMLGFLLMFTFPSVLALNKLFFTMPLKNVLTITLVANLIFLVLLSFSRFTFKSLAQYLYYYGGSLVIGFGVSVLFWVGYGILYLTKNTSVVQNPIVQYGFVLVILGTIALSIYNFEKPLSVREFTIESDKVSEEYRFVHVADTQFGTTSVSHLNSVVDTITQQNPDFVVFVGDLVDSSSYTLEDFSAFDKITVPTYFQRGNHEFYHNKERLMDVIDNINSFEPLINTQTNFKEIQITSVDYSNSNEFLRSQLEYLPVDNSKYSLLLYHDPKALGGALSHNFDLMLAGHTHGGQIWPLTWFVKTFYKYGKGYYKEGNTHIYTTDGAGLWGPRMRLGSQNEIAVFTIKPMGV